MANGAREMPIFRGKIVIMNSLLLVVAFICFIAGISSYYRIQTPPSDRKLGGHGFYVGRQAFLWYTVLGLVLGLVALIAAFFL